MNDVMGDCQVGGWLVGIALAGGWQRAAYSQPLGNENSENVLQVDVF